MPRPRCRWRVCVRQGAAQREEPKQLQATCAKGRVLTVFAVTSTADTATVIAMHVIVIVIDISFTAAIVIATAIGIIAIITASAAAICIHAGLL